MNVTTLPRVTKAWDARITPVATTVQEVIRKSMKIEYYTQTLEKTLSFEYEAQSNQNQLASCLRRKFRDKSGTDKNIAWNN